MSRKCVFPGCSNRSGGGVTLYDFPNLLYDPDRRAKWLKNIGLSETKLSSMSCVCAEHFDEDDMIWKPNGPYRLKPSVEPIIFIPKPKRDLSKNPLIKKKDLPKKANEEHTYGVLRSSNGTISNHGNENTNAIEDLMSAVERSKTNTKHCCVVDCDGDSTTTEMRQFPLFDEQLRKTWLAELGLSELQLYVSSTKSFHYVCYGHFDSRQFNAGADGRRYLIRKAVPTRKTTLKTRKEGRILVDVDTDELSEDVSEDGEEETFSTSTSFGGSGDDPDDEDYSSTESTEKKHRQPQHKLAKYCDVKTISRRRRFLCKLDDLGFDDAESISNHLMEAHGIDTTKNYFECQVCKKRFKVIAALKKHLLRGVHTNKKCDECGKRFASDYHVRRHKLQKHSTTNDDNGKIRCEKCDKILSSQSSLSQHMLLHSASRKYSCRHCGKQFQQAAGLNGHMKTAHNAPLVRRKICQEATA